MSKLTFKAQAKHTALGLLGVAAPAIILSTYHGLYAVTAAIGCVAIASIVGCVEGYGFGKHHYDDVISTQSAMIDRLQNERRYEREADFATIEAYKRSNKGLRAKVAELERPKGWVITKRSEIKLPKFPEGVTEYPVRDTYYLTMLSPGWVYSFVRDRAGVLPKDLVVFSSQELAFEFLESKRESFTFFTDALVERV